MDSDYGYRREFNAIFCRNVLIYFDKRTQEGILKKLASLLMEEGFLFLGHSESIIDMDLPLQQLAPSTYRKV
jgi:chemotaxis protein methyltransferase CheR